MSKIDQITKFGQKLMALNDMDNVLELISQEAKALLNTQRCSIFIVEKEENLLWTKLSDGIGRIVLSLDSGIVGETYQTQKAQVVNKPYEDERFLANIDEKSGFKTKNIITVPIFDSSREVIGIIQLLNKSRFDFDDKDLKALTFFANYISGSLELVLMSED